MSVLAVPSGATPMVVCTRVYIGCVVERVGIREMRAHAAAVVRRAGAGQRLVITIGGRPIAQLGPLESSPGEVTIDDLAARGLIVAARRADRPLPSERIDLRTGARMDRILREVRGA
jgi:antitoxin (DNA-binding transcriptional repressor) of toxin-antitoxin stability system